MHYISIILVFCIPLSALSFTREKILLRKNDRTSAARHEISFQQLHAVLSDEVIPLQETRLWLDLRENAIHPKAAIEQLETQIGATSFVDRILVSETVCQNLIDFNDMYLTTSRILYQSSQKDDIFLCSSQGLSTPFGNSLSAPSDVAIPVEDPMQAIELISGGKWLLLEKHEGSNDDQAESLRIDAVGSFLDIVHSSSEIENWDSSPQTSGLVLPKIGTKKHESSTSKFGGVAVSCNTKSEVMKLASALHLKHGGDMKTVTESGIILQSGEQASTAVDTAIVLPFAIDSWQVATLVFGE
jgi:hypothetical protein